MSIKQLQLAIEPTLHLVWNRKTGVEKLIARVMAGLTALAAGNSGYQLVISPFGEPCPDSSRTTLAASGDGHRSGRVGAGVHATDASQGTDTFNHPRNRGDAGSRVVLVAGARPAHAAGQSVVLGAAGRGCWCGNALADGRTGA